MFSSTILTSALTALTLLPSTLAAPTKRDDPLKFAFGSTKVRGVNLGGWFVLEPWITPSIFEAQPASVVDEYTLCQLGNNAASVLQAHWSSWIVESDFTEMAAAGLNFVRIPIGYWSVTPLAGDPYIQGAYAHLGNAINWASAAGIKVMIDLHGAPGSQNGFDNSGRKGAITWGSGNTIAQTHTALDKIRDDWASNSAVAAIELVNEPIASAASIGDATLRQFYMDGWGDLESSKVAITFHDGFEGVNAWNNFGSGMWNLLLDTHHYEIFDCGSLTQGIDAHVSEACGFGTQMKSNNLWTIAGEWTGAITDCAQWLNGRGIGARYDGTYNVDGSTCTAQGSCDGKYHGTVDALSAADKGNIGKFINAQLDAFEEAAGWIFWTWKTEGAPEWDMQALLKAGIFPNPVTSRTYPGQCS